MTTIAIAGATGAVGQQMLECLKERNIQADLKLLASARSKGKEIDGHIVEELTKESFQGVDYVLGATGNDITKCGCHGPKKQDVSLLIIQVHSV